MFSLPLRDWCPLRMYSLFPDAIGARVPIPQVGLRAPLDPRQLRPGAGPDHAAARDGHLHRGRLARGVVRLLDRQAGGPPNAPQPHLLPHLQPARHHAGAQAPPQRVGLNDTDAVESTLETLSSRLTARVVDSPVDSSRASNVRVEP
eukprot:1192995-Prorocentrum_minimum.AAC.2